MSMIAAIDRLIESSSDHMDKNPSKEAGKPLYRYHSYTPGAVTAQPRSPSPSSFSPSPYIVNFKGRGRRTGNYSEAPVLPTDKGSTSKFRDPGPSEQAIGKPAVTGIDSNKSQVASGRAYAKPLVLENNYEAFSATPDGILVPVKERNGFYQDDMVGKTLNDKQALVAEGKLSAAEDKKSASRKQCITSSGYGEEFFDAPESPFEGGDEVLSQSEDYAPEASSTDFAEHQADIERYRKAEEALKIVLQQLAAGGLALPFENGVAPVEEVREQVQDLDIAGQVLIKRMVEAAVARGAARAEFEEHLEAELETKNSEIENKSRELTRLRDKVRYNELVNREMSQRNQEAIEIARNKRRARQRKIRWALASASAAVAVGVSIALVYKYAPLQDLKLWKDRAEPAATASGAGGSEFESK